MSGIDLHPGGGGREEPDPDSEAPWILTDGAGYILECSFAALRMLNYSGRGARGRELPNLFLRGRPVLSELLAAARGGVIERDAEFRPNDRKPMRVRFSIRRSDPGSADVTLHWTFDVRWRLAMRMPEGVDRRQVIKVWRRHDHRCVFAPGGAGRRRLFVCVDEDEVLHEESLPDVASAFARAAALREQVPVQRGGSPFGSANATISGPGSDRRSPSPPAATTTY